MQHHHQQRQPDYRRLHSFPTRRSSDLMFYVDAEDDSVYMPFRGTVFARASISTLSEKNELAFTVDRSEEHTSELQSRRDLVCRLLLEKKNSIHLHAMKKTTITSISRQT